MTTPGLSKHNQTLKILVTRPEPEAALLKERLEVLGHNAIVSPVLRIVAIPATFDFNLEQVQALVVTSANALRAIDELGHPPRLAGVRIYAVGEASARMAREMGFQDVVAGMAGGEELCDLISRRADAAGGRILHVSGETRAFDVAGRLKGQGFRVEAIPVYRSEPVSTLRGEACEALRAGVLDIVTVMSPRTARVFVDLVSEAGLMDAAQKPAYVCISQTTGEALSQIGSKSVNVAEQPSLDALLAAINRISPQSNY